MQPLTAMSFLVDEAEDLLNDDAHLTPALATVLARLRQSVAAEQTMLDSLRTYLMLHQPAAGDRKAVDLVRAIRTAATSAARRFPAPQLRLVLPEAARLSTEPRYLTALLGALLDNALAWAASQVTLHLQVAADGLALRVENDGPALPATVQAALGQSFLRPAGQSGTGLGLGLHVAACCAERLGARLALAAASGPVAFVVSFDASSVA